MKLTFKHVAYGIALCGLVSCANEAPWGGSRGKGAISLQLTADADVKDALPSVRAGAPELVAPDVSNFSIEMRNLDTDMVQTYQSLDEFNAVDGFDVGSYTLTAFYGNLNECGFDKPYFKGQANVNVLEGRETNVDVTAQLANVMLSIDYTDAFRGYFRDYTVTAHTDGHANVVFGRNETRAGFLTPGDVTLQVSLINPSGKTMTLTPKNAGFYAVARHHYHVTFDVNADPSGSMLLNITFDDTLKKEEVIFQLSDELYEAEAPLLTAEGFESGKTVEALSGNAAPNALKFEAVCKSGIKSAILKIAQVSGAENLSLPFDAELDLVQADDATQNQLKNFGIDVRGFFKNPDKMGVVEVTNLSKHLPAGTFEITLTVTDMLDKNNETPVVLNLSTLPIHLEVIEGSALYGYATVTSEPTLNATVKVTYNGLNPEGCISFKNLCQHSGYKACKLVGVVESSATRGFPDKTYIFNIKVCDVEHSPLPMEMYFNNNKVADFTLEVIEPKFKVIADPFATYARFKVEAEDVTDLPTIVNGLTFYKNGSAVDKSMITSDQEKGYLTMDGLDADSDYSIGYTLTQRENKYPEDYVLQIHTETTPDVPNGDFSLVSQTINRKDVEVGGQYSYTVAYQAKANIIRSEANEWASINAKTCWWNSPGAKNTWFQVPSTYAANGKVVIRNVAYDHNGVKPAGMPTGLGKTSWYNTNVPTFSAFAAGELFLGSYSYDGTEHRVDGITFTSRPTSISFDYSYAPTGDDHAFIEITVVNAAGQSIASSKKVLNRGDYLQYTVSLPEYKFGEKAAKLIVCFKSSSTSNPKDYVHIPQGNELDEGFGSGHFGNLNLGDNNYHAVATGSVLTIDNVKLNY